MTAEAGRVSESGKEAQKKARSKAHPNLLALEKLSQAELQTLRLDDQSLSEFDALVKSFSASTADLQAFEGEDVGSMEDTRYDQLSAAQAQQAGDATALVHFLAPRILRLRDGEAKRKWRSFLTKFKKNETLR